MFNNKDLNGKRGVLLFSERSVSSVPNLNFPLPGEKGPACLVKVR